MIALCDAAGVIYFQPRIPQDLSLLPIAKGPAKKLRAFISAKARHAYDGETLLVPGVPEAYHSGALGMRHKQTDAVDALRKFITWIKPAAEREGLSTY